MKPNPDPLRLEGSHAHRPTGHVPVEQGLVHKEGLTLVAPTGLAPVERRILHQSGEGSNAHPLSTNLRSTGASPVGAECGGKPTLVQIPLLHRDMPGGGGDWGATPATAAPRP